MTDVCYSLLNLQDATHGGFKVVGPASLKLYAVHVVDKNKPLYESTPGSTN